MARPVGRPVGSLVSIAGSAAALLLAAAITGGCSGDASGDDEATAPAVVSGRTVRVSVDSAGREGNGRSDDAALSANGRFVAFSSYSWNLAPGDRNRRRDIFVHDRRTGRTQRISVRTDGREGTRPSWGPQVSADGRYVVFRSLAPDLVPRDRNDRMDVFLRDRVRGTTERISVDHAGGDANGDSTGAYISGNGTYVAFTSAASDLVRGDTNGAVDAFVRDRLRKTTRRIPLTAGERGPRGGTSVTNHVTAIDASGRHVAIRSAARMVPGDTNGLADLFVVDLVSGAVERVNVSSAGTQANGPTFRGSLSANGRYVAFRSFASNLVARDTNGTLDVFVHDRRTGRTERVSVTSRGRQVTGVMQRPFLSGSGRYVVFRSTARLVHGDTNGLADVFVHDRTTGATIRVSVSNAGRQARGPVFRPAISGSGRVIAFSALASNLVPKDTNDVADVFVHVLRRRR